MLKVEHIKKKLKLKSFWNDAENNINTSRTYFFIFLYVENI
jgi:hypothetical protein